MTDWRRVDDPDIRLPESGELVLVWLRWDHEPVVAFRIENGKWRVSTNGLTAEGGWDGAIIVQDCVQEEFFLWAPIDKPGAHWLE